MKCQTGKNEKIFYIPVDKESLRVLSFYYTAKKPRQRYGMQEDELQKINNFILYVAKGYPQALEAIYENIGGRMLSVAFSVLKDRYLAEDVVQDSFLKIAKNARRFEPGTNGIAWICKIVRNTALDYLKREKKITKVNVEDCFDLGVADVGLERSENAIILENALKKLSPDQRTVVYYRYYLDYTVRDIAKETGIPKSTVMRLIQSAEENLKKILLEGDK